MRGLSAVILVAGLVIVGTQSVAAQQGTEPEQRDSLIPDGVVVGGTLAFDGRATPGPWRAETETVSGAMTGGASLAEVTGWVEFPAASLDSDNGRRDRDMRKSLETDKYPTIRFELDGVVEDSTTAEGGVWMTLQGTFDIHGVRREVAVPAKVTAADQGLQLVARFPLNLKDYEIGGLSKMFGMLKMHEIIEVDVDLLFGPAEES